jgi:hypothetical protein
MKFLIGIISGIALAGAGVAVTSQGGPATASAESLAAQLAVVPQAATHATLPTKATSARVRVFAGELERKDAGFELKLTTLVNGEKVDRDVRVLVARARVTNRAGTVARLPLDEADARISGVLLPRSAWRLDDDGRLVPTLAATRITIIPEVGDGENTLSGLDAAELHGSDAD